MYTNSNQSINEIHEKFSEYGRNAKEWQRKCALLLPEIARCEVWKVKGFSCIHEYAAKLAGMSRPQVDDALYVLRKIEDKPALMKVVELKGLNAVRPVVAIATNKDEKFWAGKAMQMSNHTLRVFVRDIGNEQLNGNAAQQIRDVSKNEIKIKTITMQLSAKLAEKLEKLKGERNWEEVVEEWVTAKELEREKENERAKRRIEESKPEAVRTGSKHIPNKIRFYVWQRSERKCEFPNCGQEAKHLHHTNRFSSDKIHDPDQIVALCEAHHDLAHRGLISGEEGRAENWKIKKEADYINLNWYVDQQVQFYRRA